MTLVSESVVMLLKIVLQTIEPGFSSHSERRGEFFRKIRHIAKMRHQRLPLASVVSRMRLKIHVPSPENFAVSRER